MKHSSRSLSQFDAKLRKFWPSKGAVPDYVPLKTGDHVTLKPFYASNNCYVVPTGDDYYDVRADLLDEVNTKVSKSECMGKILFCLFADERTISC